MLEPIGTSERWLVFPLYSWFSHVYRITLSSQHRVNEDRKVCCREDVRSPRQHILALSTHELRPRENVNSHLCVRGTGLYDVFFFLNNPPPPDLPPLPPPPALPT